MEHVLVVLATPPASRQRASCKQNLFLGQIMFVSFPFMFVKCPTERVVMLSTCYSLHDEER
eukprot:5984024-Amphidinium_carterae.1